MTCAEEVLQKREQGFNQKAVCIHVSYVFSVSVDVGCRIMQVRLALEFNLMTTNQIIVNLAKSNFAIKSPTSFYENACIISP